MKPRKIWTPEEIETLKGLYPNNTTEFVAKYFGLSASQVNHMAYKLGLKKCDEYLNSPFSGRLQKGDTRGLTTRFKKGSIPLNKGKKMSPEQYDKCKGTMFKPGNVSANTKYFGKPFLYENTKPNGQHEKYWLIVVKKRRKAYTTYLCEQADIDMTGKIPRLKPEYRFDKPPTLDDIIIVDYKQNMQLNTLHRYPEDIKRLIQVKGALTRQINKAKNNEELGDNIS